MFTLSRSTALTLSLLLAFTLYFSPDLAAQLGGLDLDHVPDNLGQTATDTTKTTQTAEEAKQAVEEVGDRIVTLPFDVAIGPKGGWVVVREDRFVASSMTPPKLREVLAQWREAGHNLRVVAISPGGDWVVANGQRRASSLGQGRFLNELQSMTKRDLYPNDVAFPHGEPAKDSYAIVHQHGAFTRNVPTKLYQKLREYGQQDKRIDAVALGPNNSWAVAAQDTYSTKGSEMLNIGSAIGQHQAAGRRIHDIAYYPANQGFVVLTEKFFIAGNVSSRLTDELKNTFGLKQEKLKLLNPDMTDILPKHASSQTVERAADRGIFEAMGSWEEEGDKVDIDRLPTSDTAIVWRGFHHRWQGSNHRFNRLGSYVDSANRKLVHAAASGTGGDSAEFDTYYTQVRARNVAFQSASFTFTLRGKENNEIEISHTADLDPEPEMRKRDKYAVLLNGFDLCCKDKNIQKLANLDVGVSNAHYNQRTDKLEFNIELDAEFNCKSAECKLNDAKVNYSGTVHALVIGGDENAFNVEVPVVRDTYSWNKNHEVKLSNRTFSRSLQGDRNYPHAILGFRLINTKLHSGGNRVLAPKGDDHWMAAWASTLQPKQYRNGQMDYDHAMMFKQWKPKMHTLSERRPGKAKITHQLALVQFKDAHIKRDKEHGVLKWPGGNRKGCSTDGMLARTINVDVQDFSYPKAVAKHWNGTYKGQVDGKNTVLSIKENASGNRLLIELKNPGRNTVFTGSADVASGTSGHVLDNVILNEKGGNGTKRIGRLLLHTWDDNKLSGYTVWKGNHYGIAMSKTGVESPLGEGPELDRDDPRSQWVGTYRGHNDGRQATLDIRKAPRDMFINMTLKDLDRDTTFVTSVRVGYAGNAHKLTGLRFRDRDNNSTKKVPEMFLHGWDTHYISGYNDWKGTPYGFHFEQTSN